MGENTHSVIPPDDVIELRTAVHVPGAVTVTLAGELDHLGVGPVDEVLTSTWQTWPDTVTLDVRELTFINARGLACLLGAARTARQRGVPLVLLCAPGLVSRLLVLVGLGDLIAAAPVLALVPAPAATPDGASRPVRPAVAAPADAAAAGFTALVQLDLALAAAGADVDATRQAIVAQLRVHVPGAGHVSLCGANSRQLSGGATASGPAAAAVAVLQLSAREGPSHDARRLRTAVHVGDLRTDLRWLRLGAAASRQAVRSVLALPLVHEGQVVGVLALHSDVPEAFDGDARVVAGALAARAATGLGAARVREGLAAAVRSRDVIGQAKGILMARYALTAQQAFDLLSQASQDRNQRVADLAEDVARAGDL